MPEFPSLKPSSPQEQSGIFKLSRGSNKTVEESRVGVGHAYGRRRKNIPHSVDGMVKSEQKYGIKTTTMYNREGRSLLLKMSEREESTVYFSLHYVNARLRFPFFDHEPNQATHALLYTETSDRVSLS